ncbi:hypothetical protein DMS47_24105, partial [Klebsiella variicola]
CVLLIECAFSFLVDFAIPKERGLSVSFTFLCQNPAPAGFLLSESVTRMNNCPRRYTRRTRLIGQLPLFNHLRIL